MGLLRTNDGQTSVLLKDHLIGRSQDCFLQIAHPSVSGRHASIRWNGAVWELQDLGSTNGTFLDGARIEVGSRPQLKAGSCLTFGTDPTIWSLADASGPGPMAVALESDRVVLAEDGIIVLPDSRNPQVTISRDSMGNWISEEAKGLRRLGNGSIVVAGGVTWRFDKGGAVVATVGDRTNALTTMNIALEFSVSRNEEHVDIVIVHATRRIAIKPRAHHYLLLTLARQRIKDQTSGSPLGSSHGWIDRDILLKMLATTANQLAINVYRARRQFAAAGIVNAVQIIEWRTDSKELRLGVANLSEKVV